MTDKYRFNDTLRKVYEYCDRSKAYYFIGGYLNFEIRRGMKEEKMIERVEKYNN